MRTILVPFAFLACLLAQDPKPDAKPDKKAGLPLQPTRKIEFNTDEGTWLSIDVSRDGKTVLFDLLGDLYSLPIEGGEARRLTSGLAFDSQAVYSPDGAHIAFTSDRDGSENLWIAKSDGSDPRQLSKDKQGEFGAFLDWTSREAPEAFAEDMRAFAAKVRAGSCIAARDVVVEFLRR